MTSALAVIKPASSKSRKTMPLARVDLAADATCRAEQKYDLLIEPITA